MSDPYPARLPDREDKRTFLQKVVEFIHPGPDSRAELIGVLADAQDNAVIDPEARTMMERILHLSDLTVGDVMVPTPRMDMLHIDAPLDALLQVVISTAHSRFPVYEGEREIIIGILIAKDLLKLQRTPGLPVRSLLRPATFVPETKALNDLLRDFRSNRNHMAIVIDEFGRVAGLATIEDVLEEIVGEIEDEFDLPEDEGDILPMGDQTYRVRGDAPIERVAEALGVAIVGSDPDLSFDTIGGLVAHEVGHVPKRGEQLQLCGLQWVVLHTKGGAVRWFKVVAPAPDAGATHADTPLAG